MLEVEPQIIERYVATGQAKLIYRHLTQIGEESIRAAEAMHCAGEQGRYWEMRRSLYERQIDLLSAGSLDGGLQFIAQDLGLDTTAFGACLQENRHRAEVEADARASREEGVRQRPTFDINGTRLVGGRRYEDFTAILDR